MREYQTDQFPRRPDAPLRWVWGADHKALCAVLPMPMAPSRKAAEAMASIVVHAWYEARGLDRAISYSRAKSWYAHGDRYGAGSAYGYATVVGAVDALVDADILAAHYKAPPGNQSAGWQSHFRAGRVLRDVADLPAHLPKPFRFGDGAVVRLRDADGRPVSLPKTREIDRMCKTMETINSALAAHTLTMGPGADMEVAASGLLLFPKKQDANDVSWMPQSPRLSDGRPVGAAVNPAQMAMHRVFNRSLDLGGRLYGGWWQGVPSRERRHLLIDGGPTIELDFHHLHPHLLYAYVGRILRGDAYTIEGYEDRRPLMKIAFNVMINASSWPEAQGAIAAALEGDSEDARQLMHAVARHHAPIRRLICSGLGLRLQRIDSDVAIAVVKEMAVRCKIGCYPIHDSFIVPISARELLEAAMDEYLKAGFKAASTDGACSKLKSITYAQNDLHMEEEEEEGLEGPWRNDPGTHCDPPTGDLDPSELMRSRSLQGETSSEAVVSDADLESSEEVGDPGYWRSVASEFRER